MHMKVHFVNIFPQRSFDFELNWSIFDQSDEQKAWVVQL